MKVFVEVKMTSKKLALNEEQVRAFNRVGFLVTEPTFVPMEPEKKEGEKTMIIIGQIEESKMKELKSLRGVVGAWEDTTFDHFRLDTRGQRAQEV